MDQRDDPRDENAGDWVKTALGGVLERVARQHAEAEAHAAACTDRPCERCGRFVCARCGQPVDGRKVCEGCERADYLATLLRETRESIPRRFRQWVLGATPEEVRKRVQGPLELVRRGLEAPPSAGLLLLGGTAAGKTSLACAMLDAWVRQDPAARRRSIFVDSGKLSRARARFKLGADEAPDVVAAMRAPLLVLDDLGHETSDRDGCISDVVWHRVDEELPMWITTGLASNELPGKQPKEQLEIITRALSQRYDGGFARRIVETCKIVVLGGKP